MPRPAGWSDEQNKARAEDIAFMAETGENAVRAAERLGLTLGALEAWATKHTPEHWVTLQARKPRDPNYRTGGRNQWTAA